MKPLQALRTRLEDRFGQRLRELRLFGSFARAEADEDSDVDVLVVIEGLTPRELDAVFAEALEVQARTEFLLSPLPMSSRELERLRRGGRALARTLDDEGIRI